MFFGVWLDLYQLKKKNISFLKKYLQKVLVVRKIVLPLHSLSKTREQDNKPSEV